MFGLWFTLVGFIFGIICSFKASYKNRSTSEWFMLGFFFSFFALILISILPTKGITGRTEEYIYELR